MSPVDTEVVCALVGLHHERDLHQRFSHFRRHREFFDDTDEIRAYVLNHPDMISHEEALTTCNYTRKKSRRKRGPAL
jgi:hypothetical protein